MTPTRRERVAAARCSASTRRCKLMSTVDERRRRPAVHTKGAPEEVLARCTTIGGADGDRELLDADRADVLAARRAATPSAGCACSPSRGGDCPTAPSRPSAARTPSATSACSGSSALLDPPRPEVADAVARCHRAGIRIIVVTGDHGLTAAAIARRVGIGAATARTIVTGQRARRDERARARRRCSHGGAELIFARSSPEAKLRIADALRAEGTSSR